MLDIFKKNVPESQHLSPDETKDLKFVESFYDEGMKQRRPYERTWFINMAFFLDKQWLTWNRTKRTLETPLVPRWRVRHTVNKIKPNVLHILANLVKNKPAYIALPANSEDDSKHAAEVSWKVLKALHRSNQMDTLNQRLCLWQIIYGTAFKEPYFDESEGTVIPRKGKTETKKRPVTDQEGNEWGEEEYEEPILNAQGEQEYYDADNIGEENVEILSPFSIIPETGATSLKDSLRVMKIVTKPLEYIREKYENGKYVNAETKTAGSSIENQLLSLLGERYDTPHIAQQKKDENKSSEGFATIKELREKPSKQYPKGRLIRVANSVLLDSGDLPYKFMAKRRTFGIVKYDYIEVPDRFWGDTPVTSMIPIQTEFNKGISQMTEIRNLMCKPKWLIYKQHKITKTAITSEAGEVIEATFVPGVPPPSTIPAPNVPSTFPNMLERSDKDMADVGFIHEVSKGETPPGVKSGVAIQFLQEKDQTVFGPVISRFEEKEGEAGTYELEIVKEKYKEPRLLKIVGDNNEIEVFDFIASDDMPTDVIVEAGSALPQSMVAKRQEILQYLKEGAFGDPQDPKNQRRALRMAKMGGIDTFYEEIAADEREAEREHKLWAEGTPTEVMFFNDHATHVQKHLLFCNSDRARRLITENPKMVQFLEKHIADHNAQDPQKQMEQKQMALMEAQTELDKTLKLKEDRRKDFDAGLKGRDSQRKDLDEPRKDMAAQDKRAETTSKILTDVKERKTNRPLGGN